MYNFSVDYFSTDVGAFQDIHKYVMNTTNILFGLLFGFIKKSFLVY